MPDISYNHFMGGLFAQYSMMLTESHRYFAAMAAIGAAENYYIHDLYQLSTDEYTKKFVEQLKQIPEFKNIPFNVSSKQLQELVKQSSKILTQELYEIILEKQIRILFKIYKEVPERYREMYAGYIVNLEAMVFKINNKDMIERLKGIMVTIQEEYPEKPEHFLDIQDLSLAPKQEEPNEEEMKYSVWANSLHLILSYLDFVPDLRSRCVYARDDIELDSRDPELKLMMEDVMETFAHCRFQLYTAIQNADPWVITSYYLSPNAKRIHNQELLLDMYARLYSVLDKLSHIVIKSFGITLTPKNASGYPPQPSYNLIVKELRTHSEDNPYLLTLCEIFDEINPRFIYNKNDALPFYTMLPDAEHMDRIRHHIIHAGVCLTVEDTGKRSNRDITYLTERNFSRRCQDLLLLVKEAIMNTCLALEYKSRHS